MNDAPKRRERAVRSLVERVESLRQRLTKISADLHAAERIIDCVPWPSTHRQEREWVDELMRPALDELDGMLNEIDELAEQHVRRP